MSNNISEKLINKLKNYLTNNIVRPTLIISNILLFNKNILSGLNTPDYTIMWSIKMTNDKLLI